MAGKLRCPDCKRELDTVIIERFDTKTFAIDYEHRALAPQPDSIWEFDDWAAHCPYCDSLNVDVLVKDLEFDVKHCKEG